MRSILALATALALAVGGAACSGDEVDQTLEEAGEAIEEGASEVADAAEEAASEVDQAADLVGFCDAARRVAGAIDARNAGDALEAAEDLVAEAPDEIAPEAETVLDAARRWQEGDESVAEDEELQQAAEEVRAYAEDRCDPRS